MAAEKAEDAKGQDQDSASKKGKLKPLIIVLALMLGEGVGIFVLMRFVNPEPEPVMANDVPEEVDPFEARAEVFICEAQATNSREGRTRIYHIELSAIVVTENVDMVENFVQVREKSILDRVQTIIRSADPQDLADPSLQVMKRQLKFELNNLVGSDLLEEVLIPNLMRSRSQL